MGKKRVITTSQEELIKETEKLEKKLGKEVSVKSSAGKRGRVYVSSTYNNTIISLTNANGDVLINRSAGAIGFKGTKKGTSFAASKVAETIAAVCDKLRISSVDVFLKGVGSGRDSALKTLVSKGVVIASIVDITPIPHNGCRPKKPRRV